MLKIKLARFGKKGQPQYRIVVNEARDKRDGSYVAQLGTYGPTQTPKILTFDTKAYQEWIKKGAVPTETVADLFKRFESGNPFPPKKPKLSKKALAKQQAPQEETTTEKVESKPEETVADQAEPKQKAESEVEEKDTKPEQETAEATNETSPEIKTETKEEKSDSEKIK